MVTCNAHTCTTGRSLEKTSLKSEFKKRAGHRRYKSGQESKTKKSGKIGPFIVAMRFLSPIWAEQGKRVRQATSKE